MPTISLTSIPPRFAGLRRTLNSLLRQRPARIVLVIPHRYVRFPDWDGALPDIPDGVDLVRGDDHGPASKYLPTIGQAHGDILIADDDCDYHAGWLDALRAARLHHRQAAIAASSFDTARLGLPGGHRIVQGFAGILLPQSLRCPPLPRSDSVEFWVDDIWISAHLAHQKIPILDCPDARAQVGPKKEPAALQDRVHGGDTRADLNRKAAHCLRSRLDIWP